MYVDVNSLLSMNMWGLDTDGLFDIKTMQYAEECNYRGWIFV